VGYFKPAPNLVPGRSVQAGDVLGSIDVLGIVQEVTAPEAGIIAAVQAEDGQAVEFGQALADIDPFEADGHEIESASR
jgi:biotin carboxyl carrier protein